MHPELHKAIQEILPKSFECALRYRILTEEARWPPRRGWGQSITSWNTHCLKRKWTASLFTKGVERGRNVRYIFGKRGKKTIDLCQNRDQEISTSEDWQDSRGSCTWSIPDFRRTWQSKYGNLQWIYSKPLCKSRSMRDLRQTNTVLIFEKGVRRHLWKIQTCSRDFGSRELKGKTKLQDRKGNTWKVTIQLRTVSMDSHKTSHA